MFEMIDNVEGHQDIRRRLAIMPSYVDIVVILGLCLCMMYLLRVLRKLSDAWKKMMKDRVDKAIQQRNEVKDPFRTVNGYSYDYCMVFKVHGVDEKLSAIQKEKSLKFILHKLADAGLTTKMFYSVQNDEVYCKIRAPVKRLMKEADRVNYKLLLEPAMLANKLRIGRLTGRKENQWKPVEVPAKSELTLLDPYDYIYMDFRMSEDLSLYKIWPNKCIFRGVDRIKLIALIIAGRATDGGAHLDVYRLIKDGCMIGFFPLHDTVELTELEENWLRFIQWPWKQAIEDVTNYFGEKIGLYFLWLGHYTSWLVPAAVLGFFAWVNIADSGNNPSAPMIPYFAALIAMWSTVMLEFWKRKEKEKAMRWGTVGFEETEQVRPEFIGEASRDPVTGKTMLYFPLNEYRKRVTFSVVVISMLISIVLGLVVGLFVLRLILTNNRTLVVLNVQTGGIIVGILNAVEIQIANVIYGMIAIRLNDFENSRTDTEYADSLIAKTFIFQFVNSFSSLFYIAFVKPFINDIDPCLINCMSELQTGLSTIFLTRLATGSLLSVLVPWITMKMKLRAETKGVDLDDLCDVERAFLMPEYHVILGAFADYASLSIQFGYATMFVAAFPLSLSAAAVSNYVDMRVGAWKHCQLNRRSEPRTDEDIGAWYSILEVVSSFAVLTNSALVAFTGDFPINQTWSARVWIFVGMATGLFIVKWVIAEFVPDARQDVELQLARNKYYLSKIVDNMPDDDMDDGLAVKDTVLTAKYQIRVNDDDPF
jgi:hypothetical protein